VHQDAFVRADGPLGGAGSTWTDAPHGAAGNLIIQTNEVRDSKSSEDESAYYNACTLDPNQGYSCMKMAGTLGTGQYSDAKACLFDTGTKGVCCMAEYDGTATNGFIFSVDGGIWSWRAGSGQSFASGDCIALVRTSATTYECRHSANCQTNWGLMASWTDPGTFGLGAAAYPGLSRWVAAGTTTVDLARWEGANGTTMPTDHVCGGP
jgi:hypothetical protein